MEFLDDLLNQSAPEEEADDRQPEPPSSGSAPAGQGSPQAQVPPAVTDEEAWAELLEGVASAESAQAVDDEKSAHRRGGKLSGAQKATLGILGVLVVGLWAVVILLISRTFGGQGAPVRDDVQMTVVSYTDTTPGATDEQAGEPTVTPNPEDLIVDPTPTHTPGPQVTPSPTPPIATAFDTQIQENPGDIELYLQRGRQYIELGAYQAALTDFSRAKELDDERAEVYIGEGWTNFYSGRWQRAEDAFGTAIALDEGLAEAHFGLGQVTFYQGRYEEAAREFDWAAEIDRTNAEAEAWLGIASAKLDNEDEAYGAVTRAMSQTNELAIVFIAQSWARRTEDPPDIDGAQADLLYARELEPNSFLTLNALAQFYVDHRPERLVEGEQLAAYAEDWATNDVQRAVALQTLGEIYLAQNRQVDAERVLLRAVDLVSKEGEIPLVGLEEDLNRARE